MAVEHKLLQGQGAGKWLPFARTKVAALHARAKAQRVTALVQRWTVEAGTVEIAVRVVEDQRYIHIRRKGCPSFVSGFIDIAPPAAIVEIPNPNPPPATILALNRFFPSVAEANRRDIEREWIQEPLLTNSGRETAIIKASMFSGEMRMVVQLLQGMDIELKYQDTGAPTYQPFVSPTHGVFKASNGQRWIIKISNAGVVAWPMQMCRNPILGSDGEVLFDYTPIHTPELREPADIAAAISAGSYRILLDAAGVLSFYTKSPFFYTCGWAFSEDGHEAANVCILEGVERVCFLYKIVITETDNAPTSAALSEVESGSMSVNKDDCHMKYPIGLGSNQVVSFDPGSLAAVNTNAPIYCFYDGSSLKVFRLVHNHGVSTNSESEEVPCIEGCSGRLTGPNDSGAPYLKSGSIQTIEVPHFEVSSGPNPSIHSITSYAVTFESHSVGATPDFITDLVGSCPTMNYIEVRLYGRTRESISGFELARNILIVPAFDRQAVYIAGRKDGREVMRTHFQVSEHMNADQKQSCPGGSLIAAVMEADCLQTCAANPTKAIQVTLTGNPFFADDGSPWCDNGTRVHNWSASTDELATYNPFRDPFTTGVEDGTPTCTLPFETATFQNQAFADSSLVPLGNLFGSLGYQASGGVSHTFDLPNLDVGLPSMFDFDLSPMAFISIRDAFNPNNLIISDDVVSVHGADAFNTVSDYPVVEAGSQMAFVGVP